MYVCALAVVVDRVKVFGYTAWSLVDGFEWNSGYSIRRGLFYIDFDRPERTRVPKSTAQYYRQIVKDNGFPDDGTEQDIEGHFPCNFQFGVADFVLQVRDYRKKHNFFSVPHLSFCHIGHYHIFFYHLYYAHFLGFIQLIQTVKNGGTAPSGCPNRWYTFKLMVQLLMCCPDTQLVVHL